MYKKLEALQKIPIQDKFYINLPQTPGVYIFWKKDTPIYIGKAINLKSRVSSYFALTLAPKTSRMISEATSLSYIKVSSELSALLLEAKLIRLNMPQYNIAAKDDKHPLYIAITKEKYPRVLTARKIEEKTLPLISFYGPFPSSGNVRAVLRMLRRIFPYSDHKVGVRACLYSHIGLCNPCPSEIEDNSNKKVSSMLRKKYLKNIRNIKKILDGKIESVVGKLTKEMFLYSKSQNYEEAGELREQIKKLEYITRPQTPIEAFLQNPNLYQDLRRQETNELKDILAKQDFILGKLERIECFDIAHLAGSYPTASMVTFVNGDSEKKLYRHFRIRQQKGDSDVDSLREVILRRIKHFPDWGKPDLIIVDGGKPQVGVFISELAKEKIPVIGLAKKLETLVIPVKSLGTTTFKEYILPKNKALNLVERIRDEAHRFARTYHHKLISVSLTS